MTVPGRGPSLSQARDNTHEDPLDTTSGAIHDHYQLHAPQHFEAPIANQDHNTHHARSVQQRHNHNTNSNSNSNSNPKKRRSTDPNARLPYRRRQNSGAAGASDDGIVTAIVQTVNIVQVIDSAGATVDIHTQYSDSNTVLIDASTGSTIIDSIAQQSANVAVSSASAWQAETTAEGTISATTSEAALSILAESSKGSTHTSDTLTSSAPPLTTTDAPFPVFSASNSSLTLGAATYNSTAQISLLAINSTSSLTTSSSTDSSSSSSSTSSSSSLSSSSSSSTSTDESTSTTQTTTLDSTSTVDFAAGAGFGDSGATTAAAGDGDANSAASTSSSGGAVDTKKVVGGVFGGIAAVALLLVIALLILRNRKRNGSNGKGLDFLGGVGPKDNRSTVNRGLLEPGPSPPTSQTDSHTNRMTQRSSLPFFISSSLAALTGSKRESTAASGVPEQGFVRISGKKLPSVLTHGGDGFSDPRESVFSGTDSSFYRDSSGFYGGPGGLSAPNQRLALGSPMRPESGIIVMRSGPGKTPVREDNPFADPEPNPPTDSGQGLSPPRPPLGRSLTGSASGHSRGSGSRFTEEM